MKKINHYQLRSIFLILMIFSIFYVSNLSYAQTWNQLESQVDNNTNQINSIETKFIDLKDNYKLLYDGAKDQNDQLSNQISNTNIIVSFVSLVITILGILLGIFIEQRYRNIKAIQKIIKETKDFIDSHTEEFYKKLEDEESTSRLNRLIEIPEDIANVANILFARKLNKTHFDLLKKAYLNSKNILPLYGYENYFGLLFQHFPYESFCDPDIKEDCVNNISENSVYAMFWNDLEVFTNAIVKYSIKNKTDDLLSKLLSSIYLSSKFTNDQRLPSLFKIIKEYKNNLMEIELDPIVIKSEDYKNWVKKYDN